MAAGRYRGGTPCSGKTQFLRRLGVIKIDHVRETHLPVSDLLSHCRVEKTFILTMALSHFFSFLETSLLVYFQAVKDRF